VEKNVPVRFRDPYLEKALRLRDPYRGCAVAGIDAAASNSHAAQKRPSILRAMRAARISS
jgi:hypothetical protein